MNIDKLKKISSALLLTSIIGTSSISLTGCTDGNVPTVIETNDERKDYAIYVNNDIAMIYIITGTIRNSGNRIYYSELNNEQKVTLQGIVHFLKNYTLEEAEIYAKNLINENGIIRYYNVNDKEISKKLKKTK